jgi:TusA-related sulfurtransferase
MEINKNLEVILKNPGKTSNTINAILKETKEESVKIYDEVFKDFGGDYRNEYKRLRLIAEEKIEIKSKEIRDKYFKLLETDS